MKKQIKKIITAGVFALAAGFSFWACDVGDANSDIYKRPSNTKTAVPDINYTVSVDGVDGEQTSTTLSFIFNRPVYNLARREITITNGYDGAATKRQTDDALKKLDDTIWTFRIVVENPGDIKIKLSRSGVTGEFKSLNVFKEGIFAPIAYSAEMNGTDGLVTSDTLTLHFTKPVTGLAVEHITIAHGINGRAAGSAAGLTELDGEGRVWTLGIDVSAPGDINISIVYTLDEIPISSAPKTLLVFKEGSPIPITYTVTADGTAGEDNTSELVFEFRKPVNGLQQSYIEITADSNAVAAIKPNSLRQNSANKAIWILGLAVDAPGNITVKINEFGNIETALKQLPVVVGAVEWPPCAQENGLYQFYYSTKTQRLIELETFNYDAALDWIAGNAWAAGAYRLVLPGGETINEEARDFDSASLNNKNGVSITFAAIGGEFTIQLTGQGSIWKVLHPLKIVMEGINLVGVADNNASLVYLNKHGAVFTMNGGSIKDNIAAGAQGGAVLINPNAYGGTYPKTIFTMNGGTISGNRAYRGGGAAIYGEHSDFTMKNGAVISGNSCEGANGELRGGGVYFESAGGIFTMEDAEIRDNEFEGGKFGFGAGAAVYNCGSFTMKNGARITNNHGSATRALYGGGLMIGGGSAVMEGGARISNNSGTASDPYSQSYGGGVFIMSGSFTMQNGAELCDNSVLAVVDSVGGGVCTWTNGINMQGGTISGNRASGNANAYGGGAMARSLGGVMLKTGGIIYGGNAPEGLANRVTASDGVTPRSELGHAVWAGSAAKKWETTRNAAWNLDSTQNGAAGGWYVE